MKRILALLLVLAMACSFAACGTSAATPNGTEAPATTGAESAQPESPADDKVYELTLATYYAEGHVFYDWAEQLAKDVLEASNGRLKITCYQNGQLGQEAELVNSVSLGSVDMALGLGLGQMGSLYPAVQVFDAPYALMSREHVDNVAKSEWGQQMFTELKDVTNVHVLSLLYLGKRFITTTNKPIEKPEDLLGLKLRTPDQAMTIANFTAYGASPTPMAFSEVYLALQQGVVDGQENPMAQILSANFQEVQNYISLTGHVVQSTTLGINEGVLRSLPEDLQKILIDVAYEDQFVANANMETWENEQLSNLADYGMTVVEPDVEAFKAISVKVVADFESVWGEGLYAQLQALA